MKKIKVEVCVGNCCHLRDSFSILNFMNSLSSSTRNIIDLNYNSCRNCGKGPRVKVGNRLIYKANPGKIVKAFVNKKIPVSSRDINYCKVN